MAKKQKKLEEISKKFGEERQKALDTAPSLRADAHTSSPKVPGCIQAHTIVTHRHVRPRISFCRIDSPGEEPRGDKPPIETIEMTERSTYVAYVTIREERRSNRHDAPLPNWGRVT